MPETPGNQRFPRLSRLLGEADFAWVFAQPVKSVDRYFTVLARIGQSDIARLGLVFPKKRVRRATRRNELKRLARESFRLRRQQLPRLDIVVLPRDGSVEADHPSLLASLQSHWKRLSRICADSLPG